jgi:hypothetical protein
MGIRFKEEVGEYSWEGRGSKEEGGGGGGGGGGG